MVTDVWAPSNSQVQEFLPIWRYILFWKRDTMAVPSFPKARRSIKRRVVNKQTPSTHFSFASFSSLLWLWVFLIFVCVYFLLMFCVFPAVTNGWDFPTQPDMTRPCWLKNWRLCSMYFLILNLDSIFLYYVSILIELNEGESFCLLPSLKLISTWAPCSFLFLSHLPIFSSRCLYPIYSV